MISVLIVNYFSFPLTLRAIGSVLADHPSAQIIVVDNSHNLIETESLSATLPGNVELIIAQSNLGFGRAGNFPLATRANAKPSLGMDALTGNAYTVARSAVVKTFQKMGTRLFIRTPSCITAYVIRWARAVTSASN